MKTHKALPGIVRHVFSTHVPALTRVAVIAAALSFGLANLRAEQVAAPVITPPAGEYSPVPAGSGNPPVALTMTSATEGATIYYVIRDNNVISVFPTYLPPYDPANKPVIAEAGTKWVGAMAVKAGMEDSEIIWQKYIIHAPVIFCYGPLTFPSTTIGESSSLIMIIRNDGDLPFIVNGIDYLPWSGSEDMSVWSDDFAEPVTVEPSRTTGLHITFTPTAFQKYSARVVVDSNAVGGTNALTASGSGFDPTTVATPQIIKQGPGPYLTPAQLQLYCSTSGAAIFYTVDGSEPTMDKLPYIAQSYIVFDTAGEYQITARAFKEGLNPSAIVSDTYVVSQRELTAVLESGFGQVPVGISVSRNLVLTNTGSRTLEITKMEASGHGYTVDWTSAFSLAPGAHQTILVTYAPTDQYSTGGGSVIVTSDAIGGNVYVNLDGWVLESGSISPTTKEVASAGGEYAINIATAGDWTVTESLDWVSLRVAAGTGAAQVSVTVLENNTGEARSGTIIVDLVGDDDKSHVLTQLAAATMDEVAAPLFIPNPDTGPFEGSVSVSLFTTTDDASIRYSFDENAPSENWTLYVSGEPIVLNETKTIWAYGFRDGFIDSAIVSETYTVATAMPEVAAPVFSPDPTTGPFSGTVQVTISTATEGAVVYYHWIQAAPKESWYQFGSGSHIDVSETLTYYAYAKKEGYADSEKVSATFTFEDSGGKVATPTISPESSEGPFVGPVDLIFASTTEGASFRYTRMESEPPGEWSSGGSTTLYYPGPLWVQALKEALADSEVASAFYRIRVSYSGSVRYGELEIATWKVFLEADGLGLLVVTPLVGSPLVFDLMIGEDGSLAATERTQSGDTGGLMMAMSGSGEVRAMALQPGELEAIIGADGAVSGELGGLGVIAGGIDEVTGEGESMCGFYRIDPLYMSEGTTYVIVGTDARVVVVIVTPDGVDTCEGSIDAGGHLVMATAMGGEADLQIGSDQSLALKLTPQGASEPVEFAGLGAGATASNRLVNLSTRGWVGTQSQRLIAGFVIKGTGRKPVLIRAMGPALVGDPLNVPGAIEDPQIEVIPLGSTVPLESNDNWGEVANLQALIDAMTVTGAFAAKTGSKDAMILTELDPGNYTAKISGVGGLTGVSIVEVYTVEDLDTPAARQVNISTRAFVGTGGSIMILGMKADGNTPRQFLIRAVGPSLSLDPFNLTGVLEDPTVRVVRSADNVVVATNDDWDEPGTGDTIHAVSEQLGAFALPRGSRDAVVLVSLPTDSGFTVKVSGKDGATGVAIAEVYEVP